VNATLHSQIATVSTKKTTEAATDRFSYCSTALWAGRQRLLNFSAFFAMGIKGSGLELMNLSENC